LAEQLVETWTPVVGAEVADLRIRRMRTRWGSCNAAAGRIWLNTELAKKPPNCVEYIVVHEMVHLHERHHTERFRELMDSLLPTWRIYRDELNRSPLAHEDWAY
jgi:predicted metal-dependent hydrolase